MLQATGKRYIIQSIDKSKTTTGGIFIQHSDEHQMACVISIGPDVIDPVDLNSIIIVNWQDAVALKHDDVQYYVIHSLAVQAVVEDYDYV